VVVIIKAVNKGKACGHAERASGDGMREECPGPGDEVDIGGVDLGMTHIRHGIGPHLVRHDDKDVWNSVLHLLSPWLTGILTQFSGEMVKNSKIL